MAKSVGFTGELLHFGSTRLRVTGVGNLHQVLESLDEVESTNLADVALQVTTAREPTTLASFVQQRSLLHGYTNQINDQYNISKIIIYVRTHSTGYPQ